MSDPIALYETAGGSFAHAAALTPDEAIDLHHRRVLLADDYQHLSFEAAFAVALEMEAAVRGQRRGQVVFWGVRAPVFAHEGSA